MLRLLGASQQPILGLAEAALARYKPPPQPVVLPKSFDPIPATPIPALDKAVASLVAHAQAWTDTPPAARAALLRRCLEATLAVAESAAAAATAAKGSYGYGIGEELLAWVPVVSGLREYAEALEAGGAPKPHAVRRRAGGQAVADVFPLGLEALLWSPFQGEVWIEPGQEVSQGRVYREGAAPGVALVLGAGNQVPVAALDVLHKLVADGEVVILKMNPVNEYVGPFIRRAFQPLVDAGFLEIVYGGAEAGRHLTTHPDIASIHLTGSAATYDAIVWGDAKSKKGAGAAPPLAERVGAELGCVTPYIIVPGPWSDADLEYHAESVATGLTHNAGHNCTKAEVVVTDRAWPLREKFLAALRRRLAAVPCRTAYYPGSERKLDAFRRKFPDAEAVGEVGGGGAGEEAAPGTSEPPPAGARHSDVRPGPWLLKTGLTPGAAATGDENWCGVLQEVALPRCGGDPAAFMAAAVEFANELCWGTLSAALFIHPKTQKAHRAAFEDAVAGLRYGAVTVNCPSFLAFVITKLGWGAFPGSTPEDIGSGNCFVHNTMLFDHVQKSVLYGPFRYHPSPFWNTTNRNAEAIGREALRFHARPSLAGILPLAKQALLG